MKNSAFGVILLTTVLSCAKPTDSTPAASEQPAGDNAKPPEPAREVPAGLVDILKERNQLHKRQTGALLTISAKWVFDPRAEPVLWIDWAIDYDGPRRPFAILSPQTATGPNPGFAHFRCLKPDGTVSAFSQSMAGGWGDGRQPRKQKNWFSVSDGGRPVAGRLSNGGVSKLNGAAGWELTPASPRLWVQFEYAPTDRGDGYDILVDPVTRNGTRGPDWTLDAWTGHLWSPMVEVASK